MVMKKYSTFPKLQGMVPHYQTFVGKESYSTTEMQSVYSTDSADWALCRLGL